jgi:hypothetical protein
MLPIIAIVIIIGVFVFAFGGFKKKEKLGERENI